jgi:hypothetical protein
MYITLASAFGVLTFPAHGVCAHSAWGGRTAGSTGPDGTQGNRRNPTRAAAPSSSDAFPQLEELRLK